MRRGETPKLGHDPLTRRSGAVALTVILALVLVAFGVRGHQFLEQFYYPCPVAAIHIADRDQTLDNFSRRSLGSANCASAPARSIRHLSDHYGIVLEVVPGYGARMPYVLITLEPNGNRFVIQTDQRVSTSENAFASRSTHMWRMRKQRDAVVVNVKDATTGKIEVNVMEAQLETCSCPDFGLSL